MMMDNTEQQQADPLTEKQLEIFKSDLQPWQRWSVKAKDIVDGVRRGEQPGYKTGIKALDRRYLVRKGELTVIAAQSSMGKTALGVQIAMNIADDLKRSGDKGAVAIFSAEMSGESLVLRVATTLAGVPMQDFLDGRLDGKELEDAANRVEKAITEIHSTQIWIDDNSKPSTSDIKAQVVKLMQTQLIKAIVIDFLELVGDENTNEERRIGKIAQNLKGIAKTLNIPVVVLAQLNDDANKRANKIPAMTDIRYSRTTTHLADCVLLIMRPEFYTDRGENVEGFTDETAKGVAFIILAKQRNGWTGVIRLGYIKEKMRFVDLAQPFSGGR